MHPVDSYAKAVECYNSGRKEEAAQALAEAVGLTQPTKVMRRSVDQLFQDGELHQGVLNLVIAEGRREKV